MAVSLPAELSEGLPVAGCVDEFCRCSEFSSIAAFDSAAVDPDAVAVPTPLLAAVAAPTPVSGPAFVRTIECSRVLDPAAFGISVALSVWAVPCSVTGAAPVS